MERERLYYLLNQYTAGQATAAELEELNGYNLQSRENRELLAELLAEGLEKHWEPGFNSTPYHELSQKVLQMDKNPGMPTEEWNPAPENIPYSQTPVHRVPFIKTAWFRYAAAVLLISGMAAYLWITANKADSSLVKERKSLPADIAPGGERATLTLADGRTILLDSAANGHLADQSGADIIKLSNGQIAYNLKELTGNEMMWNKMTTPRGGQYRIVLPDGTNVWLNAASSITYPAVFVGGERKVKVTGEVYLEVAGNKEKPFIVDVDGRSTIQVLGTSFNINSYSGEEGIKATLIEGSVKMSSSGQSAILKPGQQAVIPFDAPSGPPLKVTGNTDMDQVLAWKNGIFNFEGAGLIEVMPQLERWYDIQVRYAGTVPQVQFKGKMNRGVKLSTVLSWFADLGIQTRLEGRTVVVL